MGRWSIVLVLHCTVRARGRDNVGGVWWEGVGCAMHYSDRAGYRNGRLGGRESGWWKEG